MPTACSLIGGTTGLVFMEGADGFSQAAHIHWSRILCQGLEAYFFVNILHFFLLADFLRFASKNISELASNCVVMHV